MGFWGRVRLQQGFQTSLSYWNCRNRQSYHQIFLLMLLHVHIGFCKMQTEILLWLEAWGGWSNSWEEGKGMPWQRWQGGQSPGSLLDALDWVGTCVQQAPVPWFALGHASLACSSRWEIECSPATKPLLMIRGIVANSASQHFAVVSEFC